MPEFNNFSVWVSSEGIRLSEYGESFEIGRGSATVSCWIPSEAGKRFSLCYSDSSRDFDTSARLIIDGQKCGGKHLHSKTKRPTTRPYVIHKGISTSDTAFLPFTFGYCSSEHRGTPEDDTLAAASHGVGEIRVIIYQAEIGEICPPGVRERTEIVPKRVVYEGMKQHVVHSVQVGLEERQATRVNRDVVIGHKIVSFVFNYRLIAVLQAKGLIPRVIKADLTLPSKLDTNEGKEHIHTKTIKHQEVETSQSINNEPPGSSLEERLVVLKSELESLQSELLRLQKIKKDDTKVI